MELIQHFPIDQIFEARDRMHAAIEQVSTLYGEAVAGMEVAISNARNSDGDAPEDRIGRSVNVPRLMFGHSGGIQLDGDPRQIKRAIKDIDDSLWSYVLGHPQIRNMLSPSKRRELDEQQTRGKLPAFERSTLESTLESLAVNADQMLDESILACWQRLSRHHKTNAATKFTERMIVVYALQSWNPQYLDYDSSIYDLDRVCRTLTGAPTSDRNFGKMTVGAWNSRDGFCFEVKPFKKGTCHVRFTDLAVLKQLNDRLSRMATH